MSEFDPELFEKQLGKLRPAKPPERLRQRLTEAAPTLKQERVSRVAFLKPGDWPWLRWAAAATVGLTILAALIFPKPWRPPAHDQPRSAPNSTKSSLKADNVEIDQQLVAAFDAVAQLPDGESVRLRCREWRDAVVLRDSSRGVVIERQAPRFEVVPVRFEIY